MQFREWKLAQKLITAHKEKKSAILMNVCFSSISVISVGNCRK